jgi:hypothetical protein
VPGVRRERAFIFVTLAIYTGLVGGLVHVHEPWRDEANLWLAARTLTPGQIPHFSGSIGSPATWPLILAPFARLGAPYATLNWLHAAIAVGTAAAFLTNAPFPRTLRVAAVFSFFLAYEYAVLARNYSLLALALFTVATLYPRRRERPIPRAHAAFFLFNTTTHGAFLAAAISAVVGLEWLRTRKMIPLTILLLGAIAAAVQLWPPADGQQTGFLELRNAGALVDVLTRAVAIPFGPAVLEPLFLVLNLIALGFATASLRTRPPILMLWLAGLLALFYIFAFKWVVPPRHAGIVLLWLLFVLWLAATEQPMPRRVTIPLVIALLPACVATAQAAIFDVRHEYSHGRQMAAYIRAHDLDLADRTIAATNLAESVLPYLRRRAFWNINARRYQPHLQWDRVQNDNWFLLGPEVWNRVEADFPDPDRRPYVLSEWPLPYVAEHGYELRYRTEGVVSRSTDERFYFYAPRDAEK